MKTYSAGIATAYGAAVRGGYTGTYEEFCTALGELADVLEDFEGFSVVVSTLEAGSEATASYADGVLTLGIPKGDKGDTGEQGPIGETPDFEIGTVTTLEPGESATASITGTAENPVLNLGIPQGDPGEVPASSIAPTFDATTAYSEGEHVWYGGYLYQFTEDHAAGAWTGTDADAAVVGVELDGLKEALNEVEDRVDAIEEAEGLHRYGVSGIGQSAAALTRLWDSVGMTAQVGTDGDNSSVINNFDDVTPFNRRKCVGSWTLIDGRAVFHVHAYYGDDDYAEDGTMGDYVAVECPRAYYYFKDGVLGVSAHQYQGWRPFDIFCHNHDTEDTMPYAYLPAYALALKDGKAVSLPGLDNQQGSYYALMMAARTYADTAAGAKAFIQPMAVNFYEWALFTVEFATQNCQSIMQGCSGLRHNADDRATLRDDGKWLLSNYYDSRVVGEYVSIQEENIDINSGDYYASHRITSITRCDAEGNASSSGAYQLVETEDLGLGRTYTVGTAYRIAARPWRTGACNGVSTPSGSPVSNTNSYYPMKYRWRENVYANQNHTIADLFNKRVGTGDDDWILEWYYLLQPEDYTPTGSSKPDVTDLATDAFVKLGVETAHANYRNGYIKSKLFDEDYPDIWIPYETTGGSASTYYCDYTSLVHSSAVHAARLGGSWYNGATAGFSSLNGRYAPSAGDAYYGADLFFPQ